MLFRSHHIERDHFVWALGSVCQLNRVPFDPSLLLQQFAPPYDLASLIKGAQALGFKTGQQHVRADKLGKQALPCLALLNPQATTSPVDSNPAVTTGARAGDRIEPAFNDAEVDVSISVAANDDVPSPAPVPTPSLALALIIKADAEKVLFFEPGNQQPSVLSVADFESRFTGQVLLFKNQPNVAKAANDEDTVDSGSNASPRTFGFRWFVPELLKQDRKSVV